MLKLVLISLEEFVCSHIDFIYEITLKLAKRHNHVINNNIQEKISNFLIDDENVDFYLVKELAKEWKIDRDVLKKDFYEIGSEILSSGWITLSQEWIEVFENLISHDIKFGFISLFEIKSNPFKNYNFDANNSFTSIQIVDHMELEDIHNYIANFLSTHIAILQESALITNRVKLFHLLEDSDIKLFTSLEEIPKTFLKNKALMQISKIPNVESWIYKFNDDEI